MHLVYVCTYACGELIYACICMNKSANDLHVTVTVGFGFACSLNLLQLVVQLCLLLWLLLWMMR